MTAATTAQIEYATKLRAQLADKATYRIDPSIYARRPMQILGFETREAFWAAYPDPAERQAATASVTPEQIAADAQAQADAVKARRLALSQADITAMTKDEISAYIDEAKSL